MDILSTWILIRSEEERIVVKELLVSSIKEPREKIERYLIEHHFPLALGLPVTRDPMLGLSLASVLRPEDYANPPVPTSAKAAR